MTEDEAKIKWCPWVRVAVGDDIIVSTRGVLGRSDTDGLSVTFTFRCIASECMMWRWHRIPGPPMQDTEGYCGLAKR